MEKTVDDKIKELYEDKAGFGSLRNTYLDVKKKYPTITFKQVETWYNKNVERNVQIR